MNKKLLYLMAIALLFSVQKQAQSTFKYTATEKLERVEEIGQRVGNDDKGLIIINGQKQIIK